MRQRGRRRWRRRWRSGSEADARSCRSPQGFRGSVFYGAHHCNRLGAKFNGRNGTGPSLEQGLAEDDFVMYDCGQYRVGCTWRWLDAPSSGELEESRF